MSTEIITSLIIASSSIICQLLINSSNRKKLKADNESTKSLIVYRIDKLEQKQDKYNHLQERVFNLEKNYKLEIVGKMRRRKSSKNRCSNSYCNHWHNSGDQRSRLGYGCLSKCIGRYFINSYQCCRLAGSVRVIIHKFSPTLAK